MTNVIISESKIRGPESIFSGGAGGEAQFPRQLFFKAGSFEEKRNEGQIETPRSRQGNYTGAAKRPRSCFPLPRPPELWKRKVALRFSTMPRQGGGPAKQPHAQFQRVNYSRGQKVGFHHRPGPGWPTNRAFGQNVWGPLDAKLGSAGPIPALRRWANLFNRVFRRGGWAWESPDFEAAGGQFGW